MLLLNQADLSRFTHRFESIARKSLSLTGFNLLYDLHPCAGVGPHTNPLDATNPREVCHQFVE